MKRKKPTLTASLIYAARRPQALLDGAEKAKVERARSLVGRVLEEEEITAIVRADLEAVRDYLADALGELMEGDPAARARHHRIRGRLAKLAPPRRFDAALHQTLARRRS